MTIQDRTDADDASVILRAQHEPEAFSALFTRHAGRIQRYVTRRLGPDAAGVVVAVSHGGSGSATAPRGTATSVSVQELAYRASAAALAQRPASPGQWVYQKYSSVTTAPKGGHGKSGTAESWQTADGLRMAWYYNGKLAVYATPTEGKDISYAEITGLRLTPQALVKYIYSRELQIQGRESADLNWEMTFNEIAGLFRYFDLPPKVTAELFQALARIPGVKVAKGAGGVAFTRTSGGSITESVTLDPAAYTVTGVRLAVLGTSLTRQTSFTPWVPVSGPGVRP